MLKTLISIGKGTNYDSVPLQPELTDSEIINSYTAIAENDARLGCVSRQLENGTFCWDHGHHFSDFCDFIRKEKRSEETAVPSLLRLSIFFELCCRFMFLLPF